MRGLEAVRACDALKFPASVSSSPGVSQVLEAPDART